MTMPRYIDAIEAEAAIKDLFADMPRIEFMGNRRRWREENEQYLRCLDAIRSVPFADVVERKVGNWRLNKEGNWACPFCEFDPYHDEMNGMNYCPNCGARLKMPLADCGRRTEDDGFFCLPPP